MTRRPWMFVLGVLVVVTAILPPLDGEATEHFSMHMVQHMLLVLLAAPLLAGARVMVPRSAVWRSILLVAALHAAALWVWHLPVAYDAAMRNDGLHMLEHFSFLGTAFLFWNAVFDPVLDRFKRVALVFVTMLQSGALGVVIAFASTPLYDWHVATAPSFEPEGDVGASAVLQDQQLAGAIMWVPPGVIYLGVMLTLFARALLASEPVEQP